MALAIGTKTSTSAIPSAITQTITHNHNTGTDGHLVIMIALQSGISASVTGVTYNGTAMSLKTSQTPNNWKWYIYELDSPSTGANNLVMTFSQAIFGSLVYSYIVSATGCSGIATMFEALEATPSTASITVSANSILLGNAHSTNGSGVTMTINGVSISLFDFNFGSGPRTYGGFSGGLTAGSKNIVCTAAGETIAQLPIEFIEASSSSLINQGDFLIFF